jgi:hypothetical protein
LESKKKECDSLTETQKQNTTMLSKLEDTTKALKIEQDELLEQCRANKLENRHLQFELSRLQVLETNTQQHDSKLKKIATGAPTKMLELNDRVSNLLRQLQHILDTKNPFADEVLMAKAFVQIVQMQYSDLDQLLKCYEVIVNEYFETMSRQASLGGEDREHILQVLHEQMDRIMTSLSTHPVNETHSGEEIEFGMDGDQGDSLLSKERNRSGLPTDESAGATKHYSSAKYNQSHSSQARGESAAAATSSNQHEAQVITWAEADARAARQDNQQTTAPSSTSGQTARIPADSVTNWLRDLNSVWS